MTIRIAVSLPLRARPNATGLRSAFTLVEIVLAIGLATGLMLVALTFYRQATDMRGQVLGELERLSTLRLVLDRLAADLRTAQPQAGPGNEFTGSATALAFVKEAYVAAAPNAPAGMPEPTDLIRVSFVTSTGTNGTRLVVNGLDRRESPLNAPFVARDPGPDPMVSTNEAVGTNTEVAVKPAERFPSKEPFGPAIRFVRFRYWDGSAWQAGWSGAKPPAGVEIILSLSLLPEDADPDALPPDAYRRVVYIPGGTTQPAPETPSTNSLAAVGGAP